MTLEFSLATASSRQKMGLEHFKAPKLCSPRRDDRARSRYALQFSLETGVTATVRHGRLLAFLSEFRRGYIVIRGRCVMMARP
jgi:hypothetical protein